MKNLFLIIAVIILITSCKTQQAFFVEGREIFSVFDFRQYTEKDFLITPDKYTGAYESIGIIDYVIFPEAKRNANGSEVKSYYQPVPIENLWQVDEIDVQTAFDGVYQKCIDMGADALVNLSVSIEEDRYPDLSPTLYLKGYRVTGFAIKRK